jgi:PTS system N-acetylgalactosamine-specific IIA component
MTGIIITGHGKFADGIKSVIKLVVGKEDGIEYVNFTEDKSTDDLKKDLQAAVEKLECDNYLFFTDLAGGSPFKKAVEISLEGNKAEVIAGTNIPMLMEILFKVDMLELEELKNKAIEIGRKQIVNFEMTSKNKTASDSTNGI